VIVDHADRLHEGIADGGPDEFEPARLEIAAQGIGLRCARRHLPGRAPSVYYRRSADKAPKIGIEAAELLADRKECFCIAYCARDLQPVARCQVLEQSFDSRRPKRTTAA
jgi:hypothetical protein